MRIVFIGAVEFSRHCLLEILKNNGKIVGIFTLPQEAAGFHSDFADLTKIGEQHGINVWHTSNINDPSMIYKIEQLRPDVIFVFGFSQLISQSILGIPRLGCIGTHPALLPKNRGRHPLVWALVEGLQESGLSFIFLDQGVDSGDILWQKPFPIDLSDDAASLQHKIMCLATEAIEEFLPQLQSGNPPRRKQDHSQATYWRKRTEGDGQIDWTQPSLNIFNLIRALTKPYVGAHTCYHSNKVLVWKSNLCSYVPNFWPSDAPPGTIIEDKNSCLIVRTGDGFLELVTGEFPYQCTVGGRFTSQPNPG